MLYFKTGLAPVFYIPLEQAVSGIRKVYLDEANINLAILIIALYSGILKFGEAVSN